MDFCAERVFRTSGLARLEQGCGRALHPSDFTAVY